MELLSFSKSLLSWSWRLTINIFICHELCVWILCSSRNNLNYSYLILSFLQCYPLILFITLCIFLVVLSYINNFSFLIASLFHHLKISSLDFSLCFSYLNLLSKSKFKYTNFLLLQQFNQQSLMKIVYAHFKIISNWFWSNLNIPS